MQESLEDEKNVVIEHMEYNPNTKLAQIGSTEIVQKKQIEHLIINF